MESDPQPETTPLFHDEKHQKRVEAVEKRKRSKFILLLLLLITSPLTLGVAYASGINWGAYTPLRIIALGLIPFFFLAGLLTFHLPLLPGKRVRFWVFQSLYLLGMITLPIMTNAFWIDVQLYGQAYKINQIDRPALVKEAREYWKRHLPPGKEKVPIEEMNGYTLNNLAPEMEALNPFKIWFKPGYLKIELMGGLGDGEGIHIHFEPGSREVPAHRHPKYPGRADPWSVYLGGEICYWEWYSSASPSYGRTSFMEDKCRQEP